MSRRRRERDAPAELVAGARVRDEHGVTWTVADVRGEWVTVEAGSLRLTRRRARFEGWTRL